MRRSRRNQLRLSVCNATVPVTQKPLERTVLQYRRCLGPVIKSLGIRTADRVRGHPQLPPLSSLRGTPLLDRRASSSSLRFSNRL